MILTRRRSPERMPRARRAATAALLELADQGLDVRVVHPSGILGPYDFGKGHLTQLVLSYLNGRPHRLRGGRL